MGFSKVVGKMISRIIYSLVFCIIIFYIVNNFFNPFNYSSSDFTLGIYGLGMALIGVNNNMLGEFKDIDIDFIKNISPFICSLLLTAINILIIYMLLGWIMPMIFGASFTLASEYWGISTKIWLFAYLILFLLCNSFTDYLNYENYY